MRERGGRIVLMDFGAAAVAAAPPGALARGVFGSPHYLAPELLAGVAAPSKQSDIYSLGVLLFFLLAGSFPVDGDDLDAIRDIHRRGGRRLLRDVRPDVPCARRRRRALPVRGSRSALRQRRRVGTGARRDRGGDALPSRARARATPVGADGECSQA